MHLQSPASGIRGFHEVSDFRQKKTPDSHVFNRPRNEEFSPPKHWIRLATRQFGRFVETRPKSAGKLDAIKLSEIGLRVNESFFWCNDRPLSRFAHFSSPTRILSLTRHLLPIFGANELILKIKFVDSSQELYNLNITQSDNSSPTNCLRGYKVTFKSHSSGEFSKEALSKAERIIRTGPRIY